MPGLGRCQNIKCFAVTTSVLALGIYSMYVYRMGILTTMEKRFNLTSKESGFSLSSFEIGHLVFIFLLTYYFRNSHYPRILAVAAICTVLAGVALSSLHFFYASDLNELYLSLNVSSAVKTYGDTCSSLQVQLRNHSAINGVCDVTDEDSVRRYPAVYVTMVITMIIMGAALVPVNTFAVAYLDANAPKSQAALYIGMVTAFTSLGSFLGFFIAGLTARIYINPNDEWPSPDDSRWLGAWWIGNFCVAALALSSAGPMYMFPKSLKEPEVEEIPDKEVEEVHRDKKEKAKAIVEEGLGMFVGAKKLCSNLVFVSACFAYTSDAYIWSGLMPYLPKYLESQYRQSAWISNLLAAFMSGLAVAAGNLVGGIVSSKLKHRRLISRFMLLTNILAIIGLLGVMSISCDIPKLELDGSQSCNSVCACILSDYTPVCGSDGVDYMTPCHAGCQDPVLTHSNSTLTDYKNYTSCSCLPDGYALEGKCPTNCHLLALYGVFLFLAVALGDCNTPGNICVVLSTVDEELRSFALGIFNAVLSLLAFVPGPTIFGAVVDTLCTAWQVDDCGERGSCLAYDVTKLRYAIHGLTAAFKCIGTVCYVYMVIKFRNEKGPPEEKAETGKVSEEQQEMLPKAVDK